MHGSVCPARENGLADSQQVPNPRGSVDPLRAPVGDPRAGFPAVGPHGPFPGTSAGTCAGTVSNGATSCRQTVPAGGAASVSRYCAVSAVAHELVRSEVCPTPSTVSSVLLGSSRETLTALRSVSYTHLR